MIPTKPYLLRAIHQWAMDNGMTPQLLVDAEQPGVSVPAAYVSEGRIVLNVADTAVRFTDFGNDRIAFSARFRGRPHEIEVPMRAVLAIFARENGQGLFFQKEEGEEASDDAETLPAPADDDKPTPTSAPRPAATRKKTGRKRGKPALRLVKS